MRELLAFVLNIIAAFVLPAILVWLVRRDARRSKPQPAQAAPMPRPAREHFSEDQPFGGKRLEPMQRRIVERPKGWPIQLGWDYDGDFSAADIVAFAESAARAKECEAEALWATALIGRDFIEQQDESTTEAA